MKPADGYLNAFECLFSTPCHHGVLHGDPAIGLLGAPGFTSGLHLPFRGSIDGASTYPMLEGRLHCFQSPRHLLRPPPPFGKTGVFRCRPCRLPGPPPCNVCCSPHKSHHSFPHWCFVRARARVFKCATKPAGTSRHGNTHRFHEIRRCLRARGEMNKLMRL